MKMFLWNILLAIIWGMAIGVFTIPNLVFGFVLGYLILRYSQRALGPSPYFVKVRLAFLFLGRYIWELFLANFRLAYDVLVPGTWPKQRLVKGVAPPTRSIRLPRGDLSAPPGSVRAPLATGAYICPGVIAVSLDARTDIEITLLACLITLTPGSISIDLSADRRLLFIHAMYIDDQDIEKYVRDVKDGIERRVLELLR